MTFLASALIYLTLATAPNGFLSQQGKALKDLEADEKQYMQCLADWSHQQIGAGGQAHQVQVG